jgi:hypothetical protein
VLIVIGIVLIVLGARARPRPQSQPIPDLAAGPWRRNLHSLDEIDLVRR